METWFWSKRRLMSARQWQAYLVHYEAILHGNNSMILKNSLLAEILPTDVVA